MDSTKVQIVGQPCMQHGPYTFYKAFKYFKDDKYRILSLGEFFFLKILDQAPVSIGELQLLWEDKNNSQLLTSIRLYFLPEDTPDGKQDDHGEDEILMSEEKIILKIDDLVPLLLDSAFWSGGLQLPDCKSLTPPEQDLPDVPASFSPYNSILPLDDVEAERKLLKDKSEEDRDELEVVILTYPVYCRLRAMLRRLESTGSLHWLSSNLVMALVGFQPRSANCHVLYCRDSYEHPDLEALDIRCDHLAPNLKGRPRKKKSIKRTSSNDSESNDDQSVSSASPSSVKPRTRRDTVRNGRLVDREKSAEEQEFLEALHKFMADRKTPIERIPSLGFKQIDLYFFYTLAKKLGGYEKITENRQWKVLYDKLGGDPHSTSAATCTRRHYEKLLLAYEEFENKKKKDKAKQKPKTRQTTNSTNARQNGHTETPKPVLESEANPKKEKEDANSGFASKAASDLREKQWRERQRAHALLRAKQASSGQARQTVKKILEEKEMGAGVGAGAGELTVQPKLELSVSLEPIRLAPSIRTDLNSKHQKPPPPLAPSQGQLGSVSCKTEAPAPVHIDLTGSPTLPGEAAGPGRSGPELHVPFVRLRTSTSIMSPLIQKKLQHHHHRSSTSPLHSTMGVYQVAHHPISSVSEKKFSHSSHMHSCSNKVPTQTDVNYLHKDTRAHQPVVMTDFKPAAPHRSEEHFHSGESSRERPSVIQHTQLRNTPEPALKMSTKDSANLMVPTPWRQSIPPAHQSQKLQLKRAHPQDDKSQALSKPPPPAHSYNYLSDSGPFFDQTKRPFYLPPRRGQGVVASALFSVESLPTKPPIQEEFQEAPLDLSNKSLKFPKRSPAPAPTGPAPQSVTKVVRAWETTTTSSRISTEDRSKSSSKAPAPSASLNQFMMAPSFSSELFQMPKLPMPLPADGRLPSHMPEVFSRSQSLLPGSMLPASLSQPSSVDHFRSTSKTESPFNHFTSSPLAAQSPQPGTYNQCYPYFNPEYLPYHHYRAQPSLSVLPSTASAASTTTATTTSPSKVPATPPPSTPISCVHPAFHMPFRPGVMGGAGLLFESTGVEYNRMPGVPPYYGATYDDLICRQYHNQSSSSNLLTPGSQVPSHLYGSESKFGISK